MNDQSRLNAHAAALVRNMDAETRETASRVTLNHAKAAAALLLGVAAMIYATGARAEVVGEIANEAGGTIALTDQWGSPAGPCDSEERVAFGTSSSGHTILGCWMLVERRWVGIAWILPAGRSLRLYSLHLVRGPADRGLQL